MDFSDTDRFYPAPKMAARLAALDKMLVWEAVYDLYAHRYYLTGRSISRKVEFALAAQYEKDETALRLVIDEIHYQLGGR